ncbi:MAG TPA: type I methionyl aminopeptidase [Syntrophomonadaceae bacterium]|nr:type I methionyl aminopeptidase [Syntrophomonadaceae bacterium]
MITIKTPDEIQKMRQAGQLVASILGMLEKKVAPGVSTGELNARAEEDCRKHGAIPVFKNYPHPYRGRPFPGAICASVNEEVVHGIPGEKKLREGDIISIDFGVILNGYAGDSALTIAVGEADPRVLKLIKVTEESLMKGIEQAHAGKRLGAISHAIQSYAESHGYSVVRDFVGHGIGKEMHEDPPVPNYGSSNRGPVLKTGMTLAIEPMLNMGSDHIIVEADQWTVKTRDGKPSAHFEHTIVIGATGPEILTLR